MILEFMINQTKYYFDGNTLMLYKDTLGKTEEKKIKEINSVKDKKYLEKAIIIVSEKCNGSCVYCYEKSEKKFRSNFLMTKETAEKIIEYLIENFSNIGKIEFFGGEPLLNFPIIEYVVNKLNEKIIVDEYEITTNAILLTENMVKFFENEKFSIIISCDGPESIHNYLRHNCEHKKVIEAINRLKSSKIKDKLLINCTLTKYHLNKIGYSGVCAYFEELGVKYCFTKVMTNISEFRLDVDVESIKEEIRQTYINLSKSSLNRSISEYVKPVIRSLAERTIHSHYCFDLADNNQIIFDVYGEKFPCMNLLYFTEMGDRRIAKFNCKKNLQCNNCWAKWICTDCIGSYIKGEAEPPYYQKECLRKVLYKYSLIMLIDYYQNDVESFTNIIKNFYECR